MSTYSFLDVACTLASDDGVIDVGYGAGVAEEGITFAMAGDKNTMIIGADGEGMHSLHADKSGQVTIRLLKTSPANAKLMNLYVLQQSSPRKWGKNTITMTNSGANDKASATKCAFKKAPDIANAKDGALLEWVFDSIKVDTKLGTYE